MKKILVLIGSVIFVLLISYFLNPFKAPSRNGSMEIVILDSDQSDAAAVKLSKAGFIRSFTAFNIAYELKGKPKIEPGGYYLSKNMSTFKIINELKNGPDLKSITFIEGLRKEQIGERLQKLLGWNNNN